MNKLFWLCKGSEYTWPSYRFKRIWKMPQVLNKPGFWIRHSSVYKGYAEFRICLIMAPYTSTTPEYTSTCLSIPEYAGTWLNFQYVPEYAWINCSDYVTVLNMPHNLRYLTGFSICGRHWICQGSEKSAI